MSKRSWHIITLYLEATLHCNCTPHPATAVRRYELVNDMSKDSEEIHWEQVTQRRIKTTTTFELQPQLEIEAQCALALCIYFLKLKTQQLLELTRWWLLARDSIVLLPRSVISSWDFLEPSGITYCYPSQHYTKNYIFIEWILTLDLRCEPLCRYDIISSE